MTSLKVSCDSNLQERTDNKRVKERNNHQGVVVKNRGAVRAQGHQIGLDPVAVEQVAVTVILHQIHLPKILIVREILAKVIRVAEKLLKA